MIAAWPTIRRDEYLRMADRHQPFQASLLEFVWSNKITSAVEVGCGVAHLSHFVDDYTGIDVNFKVLLENAIYGKGTWIEKDWRDLDASSFDADLFVASSVIEHCEAFRPFLEWVNALRVRYSVVTFHKGLRKEEDIRPDKVPPYFDNHYALADVQEWLRNNVEGWRLYNLPLSSSPLRRRWDSVLVIDRTGKADLSMWAKRAL